MSDNLIQPPYHTSDSAINSANKVGLVLSGGGAKGAYHVGVVQALEEMNIGIDMISGASIGALNGAVLASAPSFSVGVRRIETLWDELPHVKPIQFEDRSILPNPTSQDKKDYLIYFTLLLSTGLRLSSPAGALGSVFFRHNVAKVESLLKNNALEMMLEEYLDVEQLQQSIPLYVSIFKQHNRGIALSDMLFAIKDLAKTGLLGIDNAPSEFRHIQSLPVDEQKEMLLASAAIPLLFQAFTDSDNQRYTDGGQGGYLKSQGNTPITPLIEAGCRHVIVTHLSDGSLWHRHEFPEASIIEIRPSAKVNSSLAMFDFSVETVNELVELGYQDTINTLKKIKLNLDNVHQMRRNNEQLATIPNDTQGTAELNNAMKRLRGN